MLRSRLLLVGLNEGRKDTFLAGGVRDLGPGLHEVGRSQNGRCGHYTGQRGFDLVQRGDDADARGVLRANRREHDGLWQACAPHGLGQRRADLGSPPEGVAGAGVGLSRNADDAPVRVAQTASASLRLATATSAPSTFQRAPCSERRTTTRTGSPRSIRARAVSPPARPVAPKTTCMTCPPRPL
jgi:hypothetical protein